MCGVFPGLLEVNSPRWRIHRVTWPEMSWPREKWGLGTRQVHFEVLKLRVSPGGGVSQCTMGYFWERRRHFRWLLRGKLGQKFVPQNNSTVQFDTIPDPCHVQSKNGLIQSCVLLVTWTTSYFIQKRLNLRLLLLNILKDQKNRKPVRRK